jgi:hypothetical protein
MLLHHARETIQGRERILFLRDDEICGNKEDVESKRFHFTRNSWVGF